MPRPARWTTLSLLLFAVCGLVVSLRHAPRPNRLALPAAPMQHEPPTMLWAWETPEDLTTLDPARTGVAYLSREVTIGPARVTVTPRRQPLRVASGTWMMAVVRIDVRYAGAQQPFADTPELRRQVLAAILPATRQPGVRGLQIDFDATASQLVFYASLLRELRTAMPAGMPLSITALTSWCGPRSWLPPLSGVVDEAVPMFFRMGGTPTLRATLPKDRSSIAQPLCATSVGVATDETWPAMSFTDASPRTASHSTQRVYIFRTGPWSVDDLRRVNVLGPTALSPPGSSPPSPANATPAPEPPQ